MTSIPSGNKLIDPKCKRFYRNCENFGLCVNIGEKGFVLAEHPNERFTIFYYGIYGSGKFGKIFESDYLLINSHEKKIFDVSEYVDSKVIFEAEEDFYLIGFNTYDKNLKWEAKVIDSEEKVLIIEKNKSFLVCFDGELLINGKKFKKYDYAQISKGKEYNLDIPLNSILILFTELS